MCDLLKHKKFHSFLNLTEDNSKKHVKILDDIYIRHNTSMFDSKEVFENFESVLLAKLSSSHYYDKLRTCSREYSSNPDRILTQLFEKYKNIICPTYCPKLFNNIINKKDTYLLSITKLKDFISDKNISSSIVKSLYNDHSINTLINIVNSLEPVDFNKNITRIQDILKEDEIIMKNADVLYQIIKMINLENDSKEVISDILSHRYKSNYYKLLIFSISKLQNLLLYYMTIYINNKKEIDTNIGIGFAEIIKLNIYKFDRIYSKFSNNIVILNTFELLYLFCRLLIETFEITPFDMIGIWDIFTHCISRNNMNISQKQDIIGYISKLIKNNNVISKFNIYVPYNFISQLFDYINIISFEDFIYIPALYFDLLKDISYILAEIRLEIKEQIYYNDGRLLDIITLIIAVGKKIQEIIEYMEEYSEKDMMISALETLEFITDFYLHIVENNVSLLTGDIVLFINNINESLLKILRKKKMSDNVMQFMLETLLLINYCLLKNNIFDPRNFSEESIKFIITYFLRKKLHMERLKKIGEYIIKIKFNDDDVPSEFMDPIFSVEIKDPLMLPKRDEIYDKSFMLFNIRQNKNNPITREPLTIQDVIEYNEQPDIKEKLNEFMKLKNRKNNN